MWICFHSSGRFPVKTCRWIVDGMLALLDSPELSGWVAGATSTFRMANVCSRVKKASGASSVFGGDGRSQTTANVEMTGDLEPTGFACRHHVVEDLIGDGFMKCAFIPV